MINKRLDFTPTFFHKYFMMNFLKKKREPKTYEGRVISDEEFKEMIRPKNGSFIQKELNEINELIETIKKLQDGGE